MEQMALLGFLAHLMIYTNIHLQLLPKTRQLLENNKK